LSEIIKFKERKFKTLRKLKQRLFNINKELTSLKNKSSKSTLEIQIFYRYHFSSKLQRMSTICRVFNLEGLRHSSYYTLVKGSPEMISNLLTKKPIWYSKRYTYLAENGRRVISLSMKTLGEKKPQILDRKNMEYKLTFIGFYAFECKTRGDSNLVIQALMESEHKCLMLTGDAPLTSLHVAKHIKMITVKKPLLLVSFFGQPFWSPILLKDRSKKLIKFETKKIEKMLEKYELIITEQGLRNTPDVWDYLDRFIIYSRMSPQGKTDVVNRLKQKYGILYVGDGGNDVGALKQSDVGISLLSGFGNANVSQMLRKKKNDSIWNLIKNIKRKEKEKILKKNKQKTEQVLHV